ncbi:MAG: multiheme c-type cytochrome, partial [Pirellulaceae bacterium]
VLVTGGVDGEPTKEPELIPANGSSHVTQLIQTGTKGMHVGVIGIFDDGLRYQRVPMDARFEDSDEIKHRFLSYQKQMEALGLDGLEVRQVTHPSGRTYVGSEACADCHDSAFDVWKDGINGEGGPHFRATLDLTDPGERTWVKRHHDPECISCHVTGWNPQQFFPYESGYLELDQLLMHGNGCENCHGPGSHHVAAENGDIDVDEDTRLAYVDEMIVTLQEARDGMCATCHDIDNSPDFHVEGAFEEYWEEIEHYED